MKRLITLALVFLFAVPLVLSAETLASLKAAADTATKAALAAPTNYDANWKAAKAWRDYGDKAVSDKVSGYKEIAEKSGQEGLKFGEIAQKINPKGVEGWYWYGLCVGTYSDGVSIITAIRKGFKGKTEKAFKTAYQLNRMYDNCGPVLGLGRFWQVLPGIAGRDRAEAERLFNEYIKLMANNKDINMDVYYYRGELYKDLGKKAEAKADLTKAAAAGNKEAKALLAEL
jgi:tetratricopeptide (TPR) repeat protein